MVSEMRDQTGQSVGNSAENRSQDQSQPGQHIDLPVFSPPHHPPDPGVSTYSAKADGVTFSMTARPSFAAAAQRVLGFFAERVSEAQAGYWFSLGWGIFRLAADGSGFRVIAPTYAQVRGIEFSHDTSPALWIDTWQVETCHRAGVDPTECRWDQRMTVERNALRAPDVILERRAPTGPESSGWHLRVAGSEGMGEKVELETHEVVALRRQLAPFLRLPPGVTVVASARTIERVIGPDGAVMIAGPY